MFSGPRIKMAFSFPIISNVAITKQKFVNNMGTEFFWNAVFKSILKRFLDWKITLMLHWGSLLLKQIYNLDLKFKENWPKKGRAIPKELRSHIVYKFLCSNCNITYYGEIERHLNVRSGEHLSLSALTGKRVNNNKKSAVKDHCLFFNHVGSFEDFSILTYESNPFKRLIKEALLVSRDKPLLNKQVKSIPLQLF